MSCELAILAILGRGLAAVLRLVQNAVRSPATSSIVCRALEIHRHGLAGASASRLLRVGTLRKLVAITFGFLDARSQAVRRRSWRRPWCALEEFGGNWTPLSSAAPSLARKQPGAVHGVGFAFARCSSRVSLAAAAADGLARAVRDSTTPLAENSPARWGTVVGGASA